MTPKEYRELVAATANRIFELFEEARVLPTAEVAMAQGLVFVTAARHAGIDKGACLDAIGDAYDNAEFYLKGEMPPDAPVQKLSYVVWFQGPLTGSAGGIGSVVQQTFLSREVAEDYVRKKIQDNRYYTESNYKIEEVPIA